MKNSLFCLAVLALITTASSCKKGQLQCLLGKYYVTDGTSTPANPNVFEYDANNRLTRLAYTNGLRDSITYSADTIRVFTLNENDSLVALLTGLLNENGHVTSATKYTYDVDGSITGTSNYTLTYNATGNLTQLNISNNSGLQITTYDYANGNRISGKLFTGGTETERYIFIHSSAKNKTGIDDQNGVFTPYFGKPSANLLDSLFTITGTDTALTIYSHALDDNDYVLRTINTKRYPVTNTKYFTYTYFNCTEE